MNLSEAKEAQDLTRRQMARQAYIAWRMADVPAVYQNLMPLSYMTKELWIHERGIRSQIEQDQRLLKSPWRRLGADCTMLCHEGMTSMELVEFGMETSIPVGMDDALKPGSVLASRESGAAKKESSPERQRVLELRDEATKAKLTPDEFLEVLSIPDRTTSPADLVANYLFRKTCEETEQKRVDDPHYPRMHQREKQQDAQQSDPQDTSADNVGE